MAKIRLDGVHPSLDGEYDLDISRFTNRELREIKQETGLLGIDFEHAIERYDTTAIVGLAWVAVRRKGIQLPSWDLLWDSDVGAIVADFTEDSAAAEAEVEKEIPPTSASPSEPSGSNDDAKEQNENVSDSGKASLNGGESLEESQRVIGLQLSDTGVVSDQETLAS